MQDFYDITLLCKVVDNFGDIGVVYRLAKRLTEVCENQKVKLKLRIIADNLQAFHLLCPSVNPEKDFQICREWQIFQWNAAEICFNAFQKEQPHIIIECFQCGRPEWLEKLLFEVKVHEIVNIIMLDYLTAEDYAETFHCLKSLTRSARVQKVNFMPGFTSKTGGLLLDKFCNQNGCFPLQKKNPASLPKTDGTINGIPDSRFNAVFFSYPKEWTPAVKALSEFNEKICKGNLNVKLAKGAGFDSFKTAYECSEKAFMLEELSFLPQEQWDQMLFETPLLFIRGEESLSRACLYGHPFVWHAYPQSEDYQLVKVQALLERMRQFFSPDLFEKVENCWQVYNGKPGNLEASLTAFLLSFNELEEGFRNFSISLQKNGDLAEHLMTFIKKSIILE